MHSHTLPASRDLPGPGNWLSCWRNLLPVLLSVLLLVPGADTLATGITIIPQDRNFRIQMQDALADTRGTRLLYSTAPVESQAHFSDKCTLNYYVLTLQPGLPETQPALLTGNYCNPFMQATLLENGDVLLAGSDLVEIWRPGAGKIRSWTFSGSDAIKNAWIKVKGGGAVTDVAPDGNIVTAMRFLRQRKDTQMASALVTGLSADGTKRWQFELRENGVLLDVKQIWATADGGALLHVSANPMSAASLPGAPPGANFYGQERLYRVSANGELRTPVFAAVSQQPDDASKDPAGLKTTLQRRQGLFLMDGISEIIAHPRTDGSVDVLVRRLSQDVARNGTYFYRIGRNGDLLLDASLETAIAVDGLDKWTDFSATDGQVILFGRVGTRANRLNQGYFGWIDIATGNVVTRLAPLDQLGLEAAKQAREAEIRFLKNYPAHRPQLLTSLDGKPLSVSIVHRSGRPALQLDEVTEQLAVYTDVREDRQATATRTAQKKQRDVARKNFKDQADSAMASAAGVSLDEFRSMSKDDQTTAIIKGDMNAAAAAFQQQILMMQQAMGNGMPPQGGMLPPGEAAALPVDGKLLKLDASLSAFVEYDHPDSKPVLLEIVDSQSRKTLLSKQYDDGSVYEFINFARFQLPVSRLRVRLSDANGKSLEELVPR